MAGRSLDPGATGAENNVFCFSFSTRTDLGGLMDEQGLPEGCRAVDIRQPERELLKHFLMIHSNAHTAHSVQMPTKTEEADVLSEREKDVLKLIVKGYINKEIADMLNISTPTVIFHRRNLGEKIGSKSIGRQTIYAVMNGIVDPREL